MAAEIPRQVDVFQEHWRFCVNCFSLFWNNAPDGNKGFCPSPNSPSSSGHVARGWDFYVPADTNNIL